MGEPSCQEGFPHTPSKKSRTMGLKIIPLCTNRESTQVADLLLLPQARGHHQDPARYESSLSIIRIFEDDGQKTNEYEKQKNKHVILSLSKFF